MDWDAHAERHEARYAEGTVRLPADPERRQRQLVRLAMAAGAVGLSRLMEGRRSEASGWFARSAARYRESFAGAPPGSWGRLVGAVKARVLAGDREGAERDGRWVLRNVRAGEPSPIALYAATLAALVVRDDDRARDLAAGLGQADANAFPAPVAGALAALASGDGQAYALHVAEVLRSFEERDSYLDDVPVADTVLVLESLAADRGIAVRPTSALLPE